MSFATLACCVLPLLWAGEPVQISDVPSAKRTTTPGADLPTSSSSGGGMFSTLLRRGGSLGGVGATPFAPPVSSVQALTPKQQDLLDRDRNWVFRNSDELSMTPQSMNRAFGVQPNPMTQSSDSVGTFGMSSAARFLQGGHSTSGTDAGSGRGASQVDLSGSGFGSNGGTDGLSLSGRNQRSNLGGGSLSGVHSTIFLNNHNTSSRNGLAGPRDSLDSLSGGDWGNGPGSLLAGMSPSAQLPLSVAGRDRNPAPTSIIGSLLPLPSDNSGKSGIGTTLGSAGLFPDLTQLQLNPVTPAVSSSSPGTSLGISGDLPDHGLGLTPSVQVQRSSILDSLASPSFAPARDSLPRVGVDTGHREGLLSAPLVIKMPGRQF